MAGTLRSSASVSVAILTSRVLGVVRDSLFSAVFGVGALTDAYRAAFQIPNLLRDLFAEGALSSAFVPTFSEALTTDGKERAYRLGNSVLSGVALVTGLLVIVGFVFSDGLVSIIGGASADAAKMAHAATLTRIMMPVLTLVSISAVFMGMLNAQRRYAVPAFAPALFNVVSILCGAALWLLSLDDWSSMLVFSAATTLAAGVQAGCQLPALFSLGWRPRLALRGMLADPGVRRIVRLMVPSVVGLAAIQINVLVNTRFAWELGDGPQTLLGNAFRLFYLPIGLFGVALATVTTARVSEDAARGDRAAVRERVLEGARGVWMLSSASAVGLILLAEPVVAMLFEHGRFTAADTAQTVPIVQAFVLGVLPYSLVKVYAPAFYALDRSRIPMFASIAAVAVNLVFNFLTYRSLGAPGLALGTTLGALVNVAILRIAFGRLLGKDGAASVRLRSMVVLVAGNLVLAGVVAGAWTLGQLALGGCRDGGMSARALGFVAAAFLFATIAVGFAAYTAALGFLGHPGARELGALPGKLWARVRRR